MNKLKSSNERKFDGIDIAKKLRRRPSTACPSLIGSINNLGKQNKLVS